MKLVKLSLAAVVAAGSFSFANAVALDEAIQNVDLSGYLRYRYDSDLEKDTDSNGVTTRNIAGAQNHLFRAHLKFTADIADNFKATAVMRYDSRDRSFNDEANADTQNTFRVREGYLTYTNFDTAFSFGKMELNTIWTDGLVGDAISVTNNSIEGVTLAAYMVDTFDRTEGDLYRNGNSWSRVYAANGDLKIENAREDIANPGQYIGENPVDGTALASAALAAGDRLTTLDIYGHNLYGVGAIVDFEPVSAQLWVSYLNKIGTFYATDFAFNGGDEDFGYNVHAQYAGNSLKGDVKRDFGFANGSFFGIEGGINVAGLDASLGYVGFGKKDKLTIHSLHDKGQLINAGEIVMDGYNGDEGKKNYIFGTVGYTLNDVRFGVDIVKGNNKTVDSQGINSFKDKFFEVTPRISYKYSDKLVFSSFYAFATMKDDNGDGTYDKTKARTIRLEAKYSF